MYPRFLVIFISLGLLCALKAQASQPQSLPKWGPALGVYPLYLEGEAPRGFAFDLLRDQEGYLWVADDIGLKRYDGYNLRSFTYSKDDPNSLGSNLIPSIYMDDDGILWVGGVNLNQYHPDTETFDRFDITDHFRIWAMHKDQQGILWIGGEGFGLRGFDTHTKQVVHTLLDDPKSRFIRAIVPHDEQAVWVVTSSGLYLFNTQTQSIRQYPLPEMFEQGVNLFRDAIEDQNGQVWLASSEGLVVVDSKTGAVRRYVNTPDNPDVLATNIIVSIYSDTHGNIWIGTDKHGVQRYNAQTDAFEQFPIFSTEYSFPPGSVNDIFEDSEGSLWFAVSVYGARRISAHLNTFTAYRHVEGLDHSLGFNNVLDLLEDANGDIWVATDGGGLDKFNVKNQRFEHYRYNPDDDTGLSSDSVLALAEAPNGDIWAGTWGGGLNRLDPRTGKITHLQRDASLGLHETLANNNVFRIELAPDGQLYLSIWQAGLQVYNPSTGLFKSYLNTGENPHGITNFSINDILVDAEHDRVWLGGQNGLELFNPKTEMFKLMDLGDVYAVYDVHKQGHDRLWLATSNGLIRYQITSGQYKIYSVDQGLTDQFIVSIEEDQTGHLWLGTQNGLNRFNPKTGAIKAFTKGNGLASSGFNRFSHLTTKGGMMYFGGSEGITSFDPLQLPLNQTPPPVHLTKFEVFQAESRPGDYPWFTKHINYTDRIDLPYHLRDIAFEFTALNFISPADNRYKYRLLGLESDWVEVGSNRRRVRYTNLDPGKYQFQVLASNNDGVWSPQAKTIDLVVLPPWWQTWWARAIFIMFVAISVYLLIYWRLRINIIREKELKHLVAIKTDELNRLNTELEHRVEQRTSELSVEVEERKLAEAKLFHMAFHDQLTGLPNRSWLIQNLEALIETAQRTQRRFALLFLDGDRFKQVNDTHGHRMGDKLLVAATERLSNLLNPGQHAARLGGDEFTILLEQIHSVEEVETVAKTIVESFEKPFVIDQNKMSFRVSIGVLLCCQQYHKPSQILRDADVAMYRAKESGRGTYQIFDEKMRETTLEIAQIEADLHSALNDQQFHLVYQPIIDIKTDTLVGFEALIRWAHPQKGLIPPDKFIPVAEYLGLIMDIGIWVLEQACWQYMAWQKTTAEEVMPKISINLSPLQLRQFNLIDKVDEVLIKTGAPPGSIKMEITESALAENTTTVNSLLQSLREREIELMIDDFGTGYSSLSYLDQLPVQTLKIDRKFIDSITHHKDRQTNSQEIVRATIMLAHNLNLKVVAEGIETQEQLDKLKEFECDYGQGYYLSHPLDANAATDLLKKSLPPKHTL